MWKTVLILSWDLFPFIYFFLLITKSNCEVALTSCFVKLYLSPPTKTGILMLSHPQHMSPQEDIIYLEL